jgi:hypothetical protein
MPTALFSITTVPEGASNPGHYFNKIYKIPLKVGVELFGNLNIHWEFELDSLDKMSELNTKLLSDKAYVQMLGKGKDFWVAGSVKDQIVNFLTP